MKATLEFNLPDDDYEFRHATKGAQYYGAIDDLNDEIRNKLKWSDDEDEIALYEKIRAVFDVHFAGVYYKE